MISHMVTAILEAEAVRGLGPKGAVHIHCSKASTGGCSRIRGGGAYLTTPLPTAGPSSTLG